MRTFVIDATSSRSNGTPFRRDTMAATIHAKTYMSTAPKNPSAESKRSSNGINGSERMLSSLMGGTVPKLVTQACDHDDEQESTAECGGKSDDPLIVDACFPRDVEHPDGDSGIDECPHRVRECLIKFVKEFADSIRHRFHLRFCSPRSTCPDNHCTGRQSGRT